MNSKEVTLNGVKQNIWFVEGQEKDVDNQVFEIFEKGCYDVGKQENAVYLDVGANIGLSALYFKDTAKMVYAIEPNKYMFECLKKNTEKYDNIKIFNCGIADYGRWQYLYSDTSEEMAINTNPSAGSIYTTRFHSEPLDEFLTDNGIDHVDVMKIDVEGAEYTILPSDSFIRASKKIDSIVGEAHFANGGGFPDAIPLILNDSGYKTKWLVPKDKGFKNFAYYFAYTNAKGKTRRYEVHYNTIFYAKK